MEPGPVTDTLPVAIVVPSTPTPPASEYATVKVKVEAVGTTRLAATGVAETGATVSSTKLEVPAVEALPAASVATALTLIVPLVSVVKSPAASVTACALPVPVIVLVTVLEPLVKVTTMVEPVSPDTVTTPPTCVASAEVAPPVTPVPNANVGVVGAMVSSTKLEVPAVEALPAASVATALTLIVPLVNVVKSPAASVTACALPVPVTVLVTV